MRKLRVAVVGVGHLGSIHSRIYSKLNNANLVAVCDINRNKVKKFSKLLGVAPFTDYRNLLGKVDAVSIATPTSLHYRIAKDFLSRDINVLIEKPITSTLKQADALLRLAQNRNLILQVGHIERFNVAFQAVKRVAKNPKFIECHRLSPFPRRSLDVGVVLDLMIHDIDIVLGLVKSQVKTIQATGVNVLTMYEDIANARLTFQDGCVCNLTASRVSDETMRKIRLFLKNTYISLDYIRQEVFVYRKIKGKIAQKSLPIEKDEPLKRQLSSFLDCVLYHKKPLVSGQQARDALNLALRIRKKIWQKG